MFHTKGIRRRKMTFSSTNRTQDKSQTFLLSKCQISFHIHHYTSSEKFNVKFDICRVRTAYMSYQCAFRDKNRKLRTKKVFNTKYLSSCCMKRTFSKMPKLKVIPELAVMDDEINIVVTEIESNCALTVSASNVWFDVLYLGFGHFYSDNQGRLNLKEHISYGGTYKGLEPMGLFSSMRAMPAKHSAPRFVVKGSAEQILDYQINVWKGHLTQDQVLQLHVKYASFGTSEPVMSFHKKFFLANCLSQRTYLSSTVKRIPLSFEFENELIRGTLFVPQGNGPFPGVIDVFGAAGGSMEFRSALLAKYGFVSLALAYFGLDGLKANYGDVEMSYFDKAINWFSKFHLVQPGGVSMIGISLGAEIVLLSSIRNANVRSTICINSSFFMATDPSIVRTFQPDAQEQQEIFYGRIYNIFNKKYKLPRPLLHHKHDHPILFLTGELDLYCDCVDDVIDQLRRSGKKNVFKIIIEGQGHLIEPPYTPSCKIGTPPTRSTMNTSKDPYECLREYMQQEWGGNYDKHGKSQLEAWKVLLNFLHENSFDIQQSKL